MKKDSKSKKDNTPTTPGQLWRDRLNKSKTNTKTKAGSATSTNAKNIQNRFNKTASGSTARKSRKGMRPG